MSKTFNMSIKLLALFLALLTVAQLIPMTVFGEMVAEEAVSSEEMSESETDTVATFEPEQLIGENYFAPEEEKPADALCEDTSKRESNVKHFLMSDGSYTMAVYANNVHYKDSAGEWQDIDNTLSEAGSDFTNVGARIKFSKKIPGNGGIFTIHENNRKITVSLEGAVKMTEGVVTNGTSACDGNATELQKMTELYKLNSKIFYADILNNTDIEYVLNGSNIKENIIIKAKSAEYNYVFSLKLNNLTAELVGNEVILRDGEETAYIIPAPYMLDADGARSDNVTYTLADGGNGKYTLTVTADASWINADDRAFPVTVDPAITVEETMDVELETAIVSYNPDQDNPYGMGTGMLGAGHIDNNYRCNGYIKISGLSRRLRPAYVYDATLNIKQSEFIFCSQGAVAPEGTYLELYLIQCYSWSSNTLSWNNQPTEYSNSIYSFAVSPMDTNYDPLACDITDNVANAIRFGNDTIYFRLQAANHYNGTGEESSCSSFYAEGSEYPPYVTITYRNNTGTEDYWSTTSHSAGFAGSGSVNNQTGELNFVIDTLSSTDSIFPVGVQLVYNSVYSGSYVTESNSALPYAHKIAGKGFMLNLQQSITKQYVQNMVCYILTDADGTEHWFMPTDEQHIYRDVDGLGLTLNTTSLSYFIVTDKQGTEYVYYMFTYSDYKTFLTQITDNDGNKLNINPNIAELEFRPQTITVTPKDSSAITQLEFFYNDEGLIKRIYNPHSGESYVFLYSENYNSTTYSQNYSGYLRHIIYASGATESGSGISYATESEWNNVTLTSSSDNIKKLATASYSYNYAGLLTSVKDNLHNREIKYTYDAGNRVSTVKEYVGSAEGQQIGFTYGEETTAVRSSGTDDIYGNTDDLVTHYVFDEEGRTVTAYTTSADGNTLYGASNVDYVDGNEKAKNKLESSVVTNGTYINCLMNGGFDKDLSHWSHTSSGVRIVSRDYTNMFSSSEYTFDNGVLRMEPPASGGTTYISQNTALTAGEYTLAINYNSNYCVNTELTFLVTLGSSEVFRKNIPIESENIAANGYGHYETFTVSTDGEYTVKLILTSTVNNNGSNSPFVDIDSIMLTGGNTSARYTYVDNGSFENANRTPWSNDLVTVSTDGFHGLAAKVGSPVGYTSSAITLFELENAEYHVDSNPTISGMYMLSGWGKKSNNVVTYNGEFSIKIVATYYKSGEYNDYTYSIDFMPSKTAWQYGLCNFSIDPSIGILSELKLVITYSGFSEYALFDGIVVNKVDSNAVSYGYNENGDIVYQCSGDRCIFTEYNANGDPIVIVDSEGEVHEYFYGDTQNSRRVSAEATYSFTGRLAPYIFLDSGITYNLITTTKCIITFRTYTVYSYNAYGLLEATTTYAVNLPVKGIKNGNYELRIYNGDAPTPCNVLGIGTANNIYTTTTATYETAASSPFFGRVNTETSYLGTTQYFYNSTNGRLLATISPKGEGLYYEYDDIGNVTMVYPATVSGDSYNYTQNGAVEYEYSEHNRLEKITTASSEYNFTYDIFGNSTEIKLGSDVLASYTYNANNGKLDTLTYGNGAQVKYVYDALDRIEKIQYNNNDGEGFVDAYEYLYDDNGNLVLLNDHLGNRTIANQFDTKGRIKRSVTYDGEAHESVYSVTYDDQDRLWSESFVMPLLSNGNDAKFYRYYLYGNASEYYYVSSEYDRLEAIMTPTYDAFGRMPERKTEIFLNDSEEANLTLTNSYEFLTTNNETSALISQHTSTVGSSASTYKYTYDENGNITEIRKPNTVTYLKSNCTCPGVGQCDDECADGCPCVYQLCGCRKTILQCRYVYDAKGQLIREDNLPMNLTYVYTYDDAGNIISQTWYTFSVNVATADLTNPTMNRVYAYEAGTDRLISYKGQPITYDAIGNPTSYRGKIMTWKNGRQLASYRVGSTTYAFEYNADGIRTNKTGGGLTTEYILNGSQVMRQIIDNGTTTYVADYLYHENGTPMAFAYYQQGGTPVYYFYETNLQGDIVAIYDENGAKVVGFRYNAWGTFNTDKANTTVCTDLFLRASLFRYRSYIYDYETNFYYLQSRYYDPEIGRFINADGYVSTGQGLLGNNMYAYCNNNPVNMVDYTGESWEDIKKWWEDTKAWLRRYCKNNDGTYSLYDNTRANPKNPYREQFISVSVNSPEYKYDIKNFSEGLSCGGSLTLFTGGWEYENVDVSLFDFGKFSFDVVADFTQGFSSVEVGASLWAPEVTFNAFGGKITINANIIGKTWGGEITPDSGGLKLGVFGVVYKFAD